MGKFVFKTNTHRKVTVDARSPEEARQKAANVLDQRAKRSGHELPADWGLSPA